MALAVLGGAAWFLFLRDTIDEEAFRAIDASYSPADIRSTFGKPDRIKDPPALGAPANGFPNLVGGEAPEVWIYETWDGTYTIEFVDGRPAALTFPDG